eukprot:1036611-Prorocentrum_minimum.AAC.1
MPRECRDRRKRDEAADEEELDERVHAAMDNALHSAENLLHAKTNYLLGCDAKSADTIFKLLGAKGDALGDALARYARSRPPAGLCAAGLHKCHVRLR